MKYKLNYKKAQDVDPAASILTFLANRNYKLHATGRKGELWYKNRHEFDIIVLPETKEFVHTSVKKTPSGYWQVNSLAIDLDGLKVFDIAGYKYLTKNTSTIHFEKENPNLASLKNLFGNSTPDEWNMNRWKTAEDNKKNVLAFVNGYLSKNNYVLIQDMNGPLPSYYKNLSSDEQYLSVKLPKYKKADIIILINILTKEVDKYNNRGSIDFTNEELEIIDKSGLVLADAENRIQQLKDYMPGNKRVFSPLMQKVIDEMKKIEMPVDKIHSPNHITFSPGLSVDTSKKKATLKYSAALSAFKILESLGITYEKRLDISLFEKVERLYTSSYDTRIEVENYADTPTVTLRCMKKGTFQDARKLYFNLENKTVSLYDSYGKDFFTKEELEFFDMYDWILDKKHVDKTGQDVTDWFGEIR